MQVGLRGRRAGASLLVIIALTSGAWQASAQACPAANDPYGNADGYRLTPVTGTRLRWQWPASTTVPSPVYEVLLATATGHCTLDTNPWDGDATQFKVVATTTATEATIDIPAERAFTIATRIQGCGLPTQAIKLTTSFNTFSIKPGLPSILFAGNRDPGIVRVETANPDDRSSYTYLQRLGADGIFRDVAGTTPPDCPPAGPHVLEDRGAIDGSNDKGPGRLPAGRFTYRLWRAGGAGINYSEPFEVRVDLAVDVERAVVSATRVPDAFVQSEGTSGASDVLVLVNRGNREANIDLARTGDFFGVSATQLTIPPGESRSVTLDALPRQAGSFEGALVATGSGLTVPLEIPVVLLSVPQGSPAVQASAIDSRIDLSATRASTKLEGTAEISNDGLQTLSGVLVSDVPWLIPQAGTVEIGPGEKKSVGFTIDRYLRPDSPFVAGSAVGSIRLEYPGAPDSGRQRPESGAPAISVPIVISDTVRPPTSSSGVAALAPGEVGLVVAGVGNVTAGLGDFVTDLSLYNRGGLAPVGDMRVYFTSPAGSSRASQTLAPAQSVSLADVVGTVFESQGQLGSIHVRSAAIASVVAVAAMLDKSLPDGRRGTLIPTFRTDRGVDAGGSLRIAGLAKSATSETSLFVQELIGRGGSAQFSFYDAAGTLLASDPALGQSIPAWGLLTIAGDKVPTGAASVRVTNNSSGRLAAYAIPSDRGSGDTWAVTDWNLQQGATGTEELLVPAAGSIAGLNGTNFRTDLWIAGRAGAAFQATVDYWERGRDGKMQRFSKGVSAPANGSAIHRDVVTTLFGRSRPSVGYLLVRASGSTPLTVSSRTYTSDLAAVPKTLGTAVPAVPRTSGIVRGQSKTIGGLRDATAATAHERRPRTDRANFGLVETAGRPVTVRLSAIFADGTSLAVGQVGASREYSLAANEWRMVNLVLTDMLGALRSRYGDLENVQIKAEVTQGDGRVTLFVTQTDNGTGDTVLRME